MSDVIDIDGIQAFNDIVLRAHYGTAAVRRYVVVASYN